MGFILVLISCTFSWRNLTLLAWAKIIFWLWFSWVFFSPHYSLYCPLKKFLLMNTFKNYLFICLCQVLVIACGIYLCYGMQDLISCGIRTLSCSMWDVVLCPGIEPRPPALGVWSLSHWTAGKSLCTFLCSYSLMSLLEAVPSLFQVLCVLWIEFLVFTSASMQSSLQIPRLCLRIVKGMCPSLLYSINCNSSWLKQWEGFLGFCDGRSLEIGWTWSTVTSVFWSCSSESLCPRIMGRSWTSHLFRINKTPVSSCLVLKSEEMFHEKMPNNSPYYRNAN